MENLKKETKDFFRHLTHFTVKQFTMMIIGNAILALGLAMFTNAAFGNHTFHTMVYALSGLICGDASLYGTLYWIINILLFIVVMYFEKKHIGLGSLVNMLLLGYLITFFSNLLAKMGLDYRAASGYLIEVLGLRSVGQIVLELAATLLLSLGISVYVAGGLGSSPYDALPLIMQQHGFKDFAMARMLCDLACCLLTLLFQLLMGFGDAPIESRIGPGSLVTAFCTGPFVKFFNQILRKIFGESDSGEPSGTKEAKEG